MLKMFNKLPIIAMSLVIVLSIGFVSAYITQLINNNVVLTVGNVNIKHQICFENAGVLSNASEVKIGTNTYKKGVYLVNISDSTSPQYIEKLRIHFLVYSNVDTYLRVKVIEQLTLTREVNVGGNIQRTELAILMEKPMDLKYETTWFDHRDTDGYFYYMTKVKNIDEEHPLPISLITSYYTDKYFVSRPLTYSLQIGVQIEAVQAIGGPQNNWGLNSAPWEGAW